MVKAGGTWQEWCGRKLPAHIKHVRMRPAAAEVVPAVAYPEALGYADCRAVSFYPACLETVRSSCVSLLCTHTCALCSWRSGMLRNPATLPVVVHSVLHVHAVPACLSRQSVRLYMLEL
jgi:hypothetical protein